MPPNPFRHVSAAPTLPRASRQSRAFDVADLYADPVAQTEVQPNERGLDEKLRQAYFWIVNSAIISSHYDVEYDDGPHQSFTFGDSKTVAVLPSGQSYSSFVLMPLLNFAVRRRCLLVGGPGRGKTASAVLMGVLAGYSLKDIRQGMQHGQPQMTIADLLGNPLPADLVSARSMENITIAWRKWLGMRVKIVDEYNRIPTRTQSALLTIMADNYAELFDQVYECPKAAWYLTANDDAGGGTYPVIEALRDRIDVVVKALHFNTRFLRELLARIEEDARPEDMVPREIVFSATEMDQIERETLDIVIPGPLRRRLEFFASQFEFFEPAAAQLEYQTKDTARLAGIDYHLLAAQETGKDRLRDLGNQTRNGLSVRALMTTLVFAKALAYFRGGSEVVLDDLRQLVPFVLHDKLSPDLDSPSFETLGNAVYRTDRIGWIRRLFDLSCAEYDRLDLDRHDPVSELEATFDLGLPSLGEQAVRAELAKIERLLGEWSAGGKLYGHVFDDVLKLKYLHQRYTNYLAWIRWQPDAR